MSFAFIWNKENEVCDTSPLRKASKAISVNTETKRHLGYQIWHHLHKYTLKGRFPREWHLGVQNLMVCVTPIGQLGGVCTRVVAFMCESEPPWVNFMVEKQGFSAKHLVSCLENSVFRSKSWVYCQKNPVSWLKNLIFWKKTQFINEKPIFLKSKTGFFTDKPCFSLQNGFPPFFNLKSGFLDEKLFFLLKNPVFQIWLINLVFSIGDKPGISIEKPFLSVLIFQSRNWVFRFIGH